MKEIQEVWETIVKTLSELAELVENTICSLAEAIGCHEKEEKFRQSWYVPKSITLSHQVLSRKPLISNIRNSI